MVAAQRESRNTAACAGCECRTGVDSTVRSTVRGSGDKVHTVVHSEISDHNHLIQW